MWSQKGMYMNTKKYAKYLVWETIFINLFGFIQSIFS